MLFLHRPRRSAPLSARPSCCLIAPRRGCVHGEFELVHGTVLVLPLFILAALVGALVGHVWAGHAAELGAPRHHLGDHSPPRHHRRNPRPPQCAAGCLSAFGGRAHFVLGGKVGRHTRRQAAAELAAAELAGAHSAGALSLSAPQRARALSGGGLSGGGLSGRRLTSSSS